MDSLCIESSMPMTSNRLARVFMSVWYFTLGSFANNWWLVVSFFAMLGNSEV